MLKAIERPTLSTIAGLLKDHFTTEGAAYALLAPHPAFDGLSLAWMLLNEDDRALEMLQSVVPAAQG